MARTEARPVKPTGVHRSALCAVPSCGRPRHAAGFCSTHYQRSRRGGVLEPPCMDCFQGSRVCDTHKPTVCVCDTPTVSGMSGQCGRCYRLYESKNPARAEQISQVREAWRQFLVDEGVFTLVTEEEQT